MTDQPVRIKKVQPYPIPAQLVGGATPLPCRILKLTPTGALIDTAGAQLQVQEKVSLEFQLPVIKSTIKVDCVVVKFYDRLVKKTDTERQIDRWDELHFVNLTKEMKIEIQKFLMAIRQH